MTVTLEIPNRVYQRMELFVNQKVEPVEDVVGKILSEQICDTFEDWWSVHYPGNENDESSFRVLNQSTINPPARRFDIW